MRIPNDHWLINKPIAHRGLWGGDIVENSLTAYKNAVEKGFAIEIDLWASSDGTLFSFHDDNLLRMTGVDRKIYDCDDEFLHSLTLLQSDQKIPTFRDILFTVNGKVPLLIEIKDQPDKFIVERVLDELDEYQGEFAIQSFNPKYVQKVKKIAPHVIRGVLGTNYVEGVSPFIRFVLKRMPLNRKVKPDFISYNKLGLPLKKRKTKDKVVLAWTIQSKEELEKYGEHCDNYIFEFFIP